MPGGVAQSIVVGVSTLLLTGFPGFLGSALLPRLLARRLGSTAVCLVQPQHLATARERIASSSGSTRTSSSGSSWSPVTSPRPTSASATTPPRLEAVTEVWHLAAVYDLAVPPEIARGSTSTGRPTSSTSAGRCRG